MILNQCIVLQTSTPNVKTLNLPAHPFQQKITLTPEGYLGVSFLVHINLKCVTIIFQPILKDWPDHKSGITLFPNWSLCKKKVIFTNLFFYSGNCTRSNQVQCPGSSKCIPIRYLCDGDNDCGDSSRSDEQGCRWLILFTFLVPVFCHEMGNYSFTFYWIKILLTYNSFFSRYTSYRSRPRKCLSNYGICNGRDDCADGSDERQDFCGK